MCLWKERHYWDGYTPIQAGLCRPCLHAFLPSLPRTLVPACASHDTRYHYVMILQLQIQTAVLLMAMLMPVYPRNGQWLCEQQQCSSAERTSTHERSRRETNRNRFRLTGIRPCARTPSSLVSSHALGCKLPGNHNLEFTRGTIHY